MMTRHIFAAIVILVVLISGTKAKADTFQNLHSFIGGVDGAEPLGGLVQGVDGNFYGTTAKGGLLSTGTVFKITARGALTSFSFIGSDGALPSAGLIQGSDSNFYGTTFDGGLLGSGTVFKVTAKGTITTLNSFNGYQSEHPTSVLI